MKTETIISYLFSISVAAAVAFGTGFHDTVDALILTVVWLLITLGAITWIVMGVVMLGLMYAGAKVDKDTLAKWNKTPKPKWWISVPISIIWLTAFVHAGWTVTAVIYLINTIVMWAVVFGVRHTIKPEEDEEELFL